MADPKKMMVCVDGSAHAEAAFLSACKYKSPKDLLYVVSGITLVPMVDLATMGSWDAMELGLDNLAVDSSETFKKQNDAMRQASQNMVQQYLKKGKQLGAENLQGKVVESSVRAKDAVLEFARSNDVDTMFVGSRGLGLLKRTFLGSFSQHLVNHAECDVMISKAPHDPNA